MTIEIGGITVAPGERKRTEIPVARLPTQTLLSLPVTVVNGIEAGPRLWLSAAIHGDEINGVEIIRQVLERIDPSQLQGMLIAVPIVNVFGFIGQSRYLPDRRDLNRSFPGSPRGSLASRLADLFMTEVVSRCTHGIDLHTAAEHRTNLPQIRANLDEPETYRCAKAFDAPLLMHATMRDGSLRQAATGRGIPMLLYEGGEALRFGQDAIAIGIAGILRVMAVLGMIQLELPEPLHPSLEVRESKWVRAARGGILHLNVMLGQRVAYKQLLCVISDAFGEKSIKIYAPFDGLVIGHTQNPLVNQGDGMLHLAVLSD
ncbi:MULTISPECIES: succinylglutamate desuccinylase/aspartoacylase family protein [unclassified Coleofasciculus]|uniref:succinylglutamate desuccinylase/aspartoacylase family protein n=1 Tax=unclassified Coleofasciculus TaxID=2692782 RepID=UPI00187EB32D|nr:MULTISPECIES: succinylglutamate desuccinylase/aspartoacylase family protein [unclassified Coleofasciculus]MBE9127315.1 succinylglutamate desuccinylase/aspartoacylase family protein [Coleofasciculus sp. LEGE 07081]MBE9150796.1 succinylglutamate desuccinylase/aspartoacylase family protein [Coleofasciculus sp. LEGE 07092]